MKVSKGSNETTVGKTTIGAGIATVLIAVANQFLDLNAETGATFVTGFTIIFNYFMPAKKKG
jgi:hypothetical protein